MSTYHWPTGIRVKASQFGLESNVQSFTSPLSNSTQRSILPGAKWVATYELTSHTRAEFAAMKAFLLNQRGGFNTFYGFDPDAKIPLGVATGTPLIKGASQTGLNILTDGWTPSTAAILKQGDYIQVGTEMKMIMQDANSDINGEATLLISHTLIDNHQDIWDSDANKVCTMTFRAVETFV
jgi:hypothetical protein